MNSGDFNKKVTEIVNNIRAEASEVLKTEGIYSVKKNFDMGGRPTAWVPSKKLKSAKLMAKYGNKTLKNSGALMSVSGDADRERGKVKIFPSSAAKDYAYIHQFGGVINRRGGARPVRNNRYAKEKWAKGRKKGSIGVRYHKAYSITIPARPHLLIPVSDYSRILGVLRYTLQRYAS